jgi:hypothetical protein
MLQQMAAVAELEAGLISTRTKGGIGGSEGPRQEARRQSGRQAFS